MFSSLIELEDLPQRRRVRQREEKEILKLLYLQRESGVWPRGGSGAKGRRERGDLGGETLILRRGTSRPHIYKVLSLLKSHTKFNFS